MKQLKFVVCSYSLDPIHLIKKISKFEKKFNFEARGIIVCNNNNKNKNDNYNKWMVVNGSNKFHDFSAYFEGIKLFKNKKLHNLIFLNDTFFIKHDYVYEFKLLFKNISLLDDIEEPVMIGRTSRYYSICHKNPWSNLNIFVPTYFFALNKKAIQIMQNLENFLRKDKYTGDIKSKLFKKKINPSFYNLLISTVLFNNSPYQWNLDFKKRSKKILEKKALTIYFEHRLSGEIGKIGCIVPTIAGNNEYFIYILRKIINLIIPK